MKAKNNNSVRASAVQSTLAVSLLSASAILADLSSVSQLLARNPGQVPAAPATFEPSGAMTFTVTSTADTDGSVCGADCTLRQAINASNANPPPQNMTNLISFNIDSGNPNNNCDATTHVCTITPGFFNWPNIKRPVTIDGYTQPGASPNMLPVGDNAHLKIKIDGSSLSGSAALYLQSCSICNGSNSDGSTIKGLVIDNLNGDAIHIQGANNCTIVGNFLGLDSDGSTQRGSGFGINIQPATDSELATGTKIGSTAPADRNIIATSNLGALINGAGHAGGASSTIVQGNYIGTTASGTVNLPVNVGIELSQNTSNDLIGGTAAGAGNVIVATTGILFDNNPISNTFQGNLIGTDVTGTIGFGGFRGISGNGVNNMIGGSAPGAGNLISGFQVAISVPGGGGNTGWIIQGNRIGTDITGTMAIGNSCNGIAVSSGTGAIGGINIGEGNVIAFSATQGVTMDGGTFRILGNSIFSNGGLGIKLNNTSCVLQVPTDNSHCAARNYPVITSASFSGGNVTLSGTLDSAPNTMFRLEFFSSAQGDPSGNGEGQTFLGATNVATSGDCNSSFPPLTFPIPDSQPYLTATATRLDAMGNPIETSEFSAFYYHPPMSTGAVSRKIHGGAGSFDINLPLTGNVGVECRSGGSTNDYQMIISFATSVTVGSASVTSGTGSVSSFSVNGSQVTVNLTGVTNVQRITATLFNVNDGTNRGNVPVSMGVLIGDVNGNAAVNATDVAQTKSQVGHPVDTSNFREDVNANGTISATDVAQVKAKVGSSLPPQ